MSAIEIASLTKSFGATRVLTDVDLSVPKSSITAILGDSGSGKTTLLRIIAGIERIDAGSVRIGDTVVDDGRRSVPAQHRSVGYVPQDGALFPHLTVAGNIGFGLAKRRRAKVAELIDLAGLTGLDRRYPHQLSGGQQQRVALARALAVEPKVVLLDEPFSSLDATLRNSLRRDVVRLLTATGTTTVIVTHDQDEALALADQVAVLRDGRVVACDDPRELYRNPPDATAATFIGEANLLVGHTTAGVARCVLGSVVVHTGGATSGDGPCRLLLRPEQLVLGTEPAEGATAATVAEFQYHGHDGLAYLTLDPDRGEPLLARVEGDEVLHPGQTVWVKVSGSARAWPAPGADPGGVHESSSTPPVSTRGGR